MGAHEHGREAHVRPPGVHHLLHREALQAYEGQVHEPLHEREVPPIAAGQSIIISIIIFFRNET